MHGHESSTIITVLDERNGLNFFIKHAENLPNVRPDFNRRLDRNNTTNILKVSDQSSYLAK